MKKIDLFLYCIYCVPFTNTHAERTTIVVIQTSSDEEKDFFESCRLVVCNHLVKPVDSKNITEAFLINLN